MLAILAQISPLFMIIALGYAAIRWHIQSLAALRGLGRYVLLWALPALIIGALASEPIKTVMQPAYFAGYAAGSLLSFAVGIGISRLRKQPLTTSVVNGFGQAMSNSGFIGYPILLTVIGTPAAGFFALNALIENLIMLPLFLILGDCTRSGQMPTWGQLRRILLNMLRNPMILGMITGIALSVTGIRLPDFTLRFLTIMANSGAALALFVIGGQLVGLRLRGSLPDICQISVGKLIMHPILIGACIYFFGGTQEMIFAGCLFGSVTMVSVYPLLGARYGHERRCAAAMLITTIGSIFSITTIIYLYRLLNA